MQMERQIHFRKSELLLAIEIGKTFKNHYRAERANDFGNEWWDRRLACPSADLFDATLTKTW